MEFERREDAEKARDLMDGGQIDGNVITVQVGGWGGGEGAEPLLADAVPTG